MKQNILHISLFLCLFSLLFPAQAQVTLTQNNFPRLASFIDTVRYVDEIGIAPPTEGANQVWDYSTLPTGEFRDGEHFDATNDPDFPNALNHFGGLLVFQAFAVPIEVYEAVDADGFYRPGLSVTETSFSLTALSGGPDDFITFIGGAVPYEGRYDLIQFPATYQNQWTQTQSRTTDFELTIAAFALDGTPSKQVRASTYTREVVGHGMLTIPKEDGTPSEPMDALLIKAERILVDSFFLAGAPAPDALLAAFGLTQGGTRTSAFYVFYKPDFGAPILDMGLLSTGEIEDVFYRPQAGEGMSTSVGEIESTSIKSFPNPASGGETLSFYTEKPIAAGQLSLYDLNGRLVHQVSFESHSGYEFQMTVPEELGAGLFMYQVNDEKGTPIGMGKLHLN